MPNKKERLDALEQEVATLKKQWELLREAITVTDIPKPDPINYDRGGAYSG